MASKEYSKDVSWEQHQEMMESVDARADRRQEVLARLPAGIGMVIRGRHRDYEARTLSGPPVVPENLIIAAGRRLAWRGVTPNQFTVGLPNLVDSESYQAYVTGGNRHNKRYESDPELKEQAKLARQRQTQHVADRLHRNMWSEWQLARLYRAALVNVGKSISHGEELNETAAQLSASATEDYGFSLKESNYYKLIERGGYLFDSLITIGKLAVQNTASLGAQSKNLYLLVQREQERRESLYGDMLYLYEQPVEEGWGGYRRTAQDEADESANQALITELSAD